jgi:hypothetical protein
MLVTSRPAGIDESRYAGFHRLRLAPLTQEQQTQALEQRLGKERASTLGLYLDILPLDEDGRRVTANPLMLSMVASVSEIRSGLAMPRTVAELYATASQAMLARGGAKSKAHEQLSKLLDVCSRQMLGHEMRSHPLHQRRVPTLSRLHRRGDGASIPHTACARTCCGSSSSLRRTYRSGA